MQRHNAHVLFPVRSSSPHLERRHSPNNLNDNKHLSFFLTLQSPTSSNDSSPLCRSIPDKIHAYFGGTVAFYFSFLEFYTWSLLPPAILGLILTVFSGTTLPYLSSSAS